jgi:hypothetical protein
MWIVDLSKGVVRSDEQQTPILAPISNSAGGVPEDDIRHLPGAGWAKLGEPPGDSFRRLTRSALGHLPGRCRLG